LTDKKPALKQEQDKRFAKSIGKMKAAKQRQERQNKWTRVFLLSFAVFFVAFCVISLPITAAPPIPTIHLITSAPKT